MKGPHVEVEVIANCGAASALINIDASQGEAPYIFDLGNGPTTANTFRNIDAGIYQLRVLDAKGCETIEI